MPDESLEFSNFNWPSLIKHLMQMLWSNAATDERLNWSSLDLSRATRLNCPALKPPLSSLLILHGKDANDIRILSNQASSLFISKQ
jgi:hypothetical protein